MKSKSLITLMMIALLAGNAYAQKPPVKDYLWKYKGKKKEHTVGGYIGISGSYTEVMSKPAGYLGAQLGIVFDKRYAIGLAGNALWYDYALSEAVSNGTYHLEAGYAGIFFEYMQPLGSRIRLTFSLLTGMGVAKYTYDKAYRDSMPWYQRTIDTRDFSFIEPGIGLMGRVAKKWWIGLNGSYRATSPINLPSAPVNLLNNFSAGISVRFGIF
jgi:hypothetical protein